MNQSVKAALQFVVLVAAIVGVVAWAMPRYATPTVWAVRLGAMAIVAVAGWLLVLNPARTERIPDVLRTVSDHYFERGGVAFVVVPSVSPEGVCHIDLYVQNRYERPAEIRIDVKPSVPNLGLVRPPLEWVDQTIVCGGGAVMVRRVPYPVPAGYAGRAVTFDVSADARYPSGRGRKLRFRRGIEVKPIRNEAARVGCMVALAPLGILFISRPNRLRTSLPGGAVEVVPTGVGVQDRGVWEPDLPTGGFPVVQDGREATTDREAE